ncbi:CaiB/BaiF CoA transferase family protein [Azospirillum rugosum]|uniref:CoA:oxalate CoA-transferase n=1 Tax=Azospirillum rugosum TaxID=416170 RepID=A0ABS4SXK7_9PROT|nr:CoA transferase [Azospirillum rugosum]MBP2296813.1 CoA:oxalate CoA-transferase [Azospirillum rugosum]MDQ0530416.1 CoA:oxalate CoA-transferase [Azospirillum rugosum]
MSGPAKNGPLHGLKVLDLSRFIAGPHCGMQLGDLGADVVKVERPKRGDDTRALEPHVGGESLYFMVFNRNKRSITLNFRDPRAHTILREMVKQADILIENFRPGTMEKMGCGWDDLRAINPRLIMARISGYGQEGPMAGEPCFDGIAQATSGLMEITGDPDGPPTMGGTFLVDYATALYATVGILAALEDRHKTGKGQMVDASLMGSAVSMLVTAIPEQAMLGRAMTRVGNRDRYSAPAQTFQAGDGKWLHMVAGNDAHFPRLTRIMNRPDLLTDPRFATLDARMRNIEAIEAIVAEWIAGMPADDVVALLRQAELPSAKIATLPDLLANPYMREAKQIVDIPHAKTGSFTTHGLTVRLSDSPGSIRRAAPVLGEHTEDVLGEWLGMTHSDVASLRDGGIV